MAEPIFSRRGITILIAVIGAAFIVERVVASADGDGDTVAAASPARVGTTRSPVRLPVAAETLLRLDRLASERAAPADDEAIGKLFEPQSWQPPQPKPVAVAAAPPVRPAPPPFPYAYIGGMSDGAARTAFFTRGERVLPVHPGDTIDAVYHVDELNDAQMILTYLPLHETVTVALGAGQ